MTLNPSQNLVVSAIDGVWVVIAGPGSGKTRCMVERYIKMRMEGIPDKDILNLTFTAAAAEEMANRVGLVDSVKVFRTFHSFALALMQAERQHVPFQLCDTVIPVRGEDYQLLFDLVKAYPAIRNFRELQGKLSEWKRSNVTPEQAISEAIGVGYYFANAYKDYEETCREQGWLDFDSLMREAVLLLRNNEQVRLRNQRKYLAVDEAQDTDITQFELLKLLFAGNILVVGDENQLIYEWRSAQPGSLTNFEKQFPGAQKLYLGQNYRSTKKLVQFFKEILPEDNGLASHMMTENPEGVDPVLKSYIDPDQEIRDILDEAAKDPENSVIIARTNRQLFNVQRTAASKGIKYKNLGKKDYWEQNEVKALLSLAKDVNQHQPAASALSGIIRDQNLYNRYRNTGDLLNSDPIENLNNVVKVAGQKQMTVAEFLNYIRKLTYGRKSRKEKDLMLATVHQAKGREWKHVFIVGAEHGKMPHAEGELPEEKRIFFVAASRAAEDLQISWSGKRSMFLEKYEERVQNILPEGSQDAALVY